MMLFIPDSWKPLVKPIIQKIEEYNASHKSKISVLQVKEKFGSLRMYMSYPDDEESLKEIKEMIVIAKKNAEHTCANCGASATIKYDRPYIIPLCETCIEKETK